MAEEYNSFLKKSLDLKSVREERNRDMSRDKLFKTANITIIPINYIFISIYPFTVPFPN